MIMPKTSQKKNSNMNKLSQLNFVFWGTPEVASNTLEILKQAGFLPSLIITSPDARAGRKMLLTPPPVKVWAEENNIPYIQPKNTAELLGFFSSDKAVIARGVEKKILEVELSVVVAYGKIIPKNILNIPRLGSINVHYSLLPKYRGASPIESAILNGETETGVTIQQMVYQMDAGPIIAQEKVAILENETAPELRKRLINIGGGLLVKIVSDFVIGKIKTVPQNEQEATHYGKIKKEDGLIDLNDDAKKNYNKFRAYAHWPRIFFFRNNKRIIITDATLENGKFVIKKVIPEGGKEIDYNP